MDERKALILNIIIQEHIKTGLPVGSGVLVEKYKINVSPATVRNDMSALEDEGFIAQPHTSAGRVPTEKAYRKYLENVKAKKLSKLEEAELAEALRDQEGYKDLAKAVSQLIGATVFWAPHRNNLFYTGISNLLQQPEFSQLNLIYDISGIIDRFDEIIEEEYNKFVRGTSVLIGRENPFSAHCGTIILKYRHGEHEGLFGLLGPMRMDYPRYLGIIQFLEERLGK